MFMKLMDRYDLRQFRTIAAGRQFRVSPKVLQRAMTELVKARILEVGQVSPNPMYRLTEEARLSRGELAVWVRREQQRSPRSRAIVVPEDPLDVPQWLAELRVPGRQQ